MRVSHPVLVVLLVLMGLFLVDSGTRYVKPLLNEAPDVAFAYCTPARTLGYMAAGARVGYAESTVTSTTNVTIYTSTTSVSYTTTTTTYKLTLLTVETTSTTTSVTATYVSTSWESITLLTTVTVQSTLWFTEATSTTITLTETSTVFSPTITVPTTRVTSAGTTIYSPTVTLTSTTSTGTTTITTSTIMTTTTAYSPTVTMTSTMRIVTTIIPPSVVRPCIIASAAYGSELAEPVRFLREFRDQKVRTTFAGAEFMKAFDALYYSFSPVVAEAMAADPTTGSLVRTSISPLIKSLSLASRMFRLLPMNSELATLLTGIVASGLIGVIYVTPFAVSWAIRKKLRTAGDQ